MKLLKFVGIRRSSSELLCAKCLSLFARENQLELIENLCFFMPNRLKIIKIIHILLVLGMNSTQFQLIFSSKNLKNLRKSMTIQ